MSYNLDAHEPEYRSPTFLAKLVTFAFVPYAAASAYALALFVKGLGLASELSAGGDVPMSELEAYDAAFESMVVPLYGFQLLGIIAFCVWTHRVARNVLAFGEHGDTPGWSVGFFFVPILNLWKPLSMLSHVYAASDPARRDDADRWSLSARGVPPYFLAWWLVWFVSRALNKVTESKAKHIDGPESWTSMLHVGIAASVVEIIALGLMFGVVWSITRRQELRGQPGVPRAAIV
jgi:hypothetical protein